MSRDQSPKSRAVTAGTGCVDTRTLSRMWSPGSRLTYGTLALTSRYRWSARPMNHGTRPTPVSISTI